jgi:hypothetical protein
MKIFRTKTRAPFMITVEVVRIDEIINKLIKSEKDRHINFNKKMNSDILNHSVNHISDRNTTSGNVSGARARSFSTANPNSEPNLDLMITNKSKADDSIKPNKNYFNSNEIKNSDLSRPVIISNLEAENKRQPLRGEKKIILEEKEEFEESFVRDDMDELVKRRITIYNMSNKDNNPNKNIAREAIDHQDEKDEVFIKFKNETRNISTYTHHKNELDNKSNAEENIDEEEINIEKPSRDSVISLRNHSVNVEFENIFGEVFDSQSDRIKRTSPFGQFSTWRITNIMSI